MKSKERPYVLYVAEIIYSEISKIKKDNKTYTNVEAIENFIGSKTYNEISSGKFHDLWLNELKENNFIDKKNNSRIPNETIELIKIQKDMMLIDLLNQWVFTNNQI